MIGKIALEGLQFHAFHGVYPHERESGNFFELDIAVQTDFSAAAEQDDINATVNYESIFRIVKEEMDQPSKLLETVAKKIIDHIMEAFPSVDLVELKIS